MCSIGVHSLSLQRSNQHAMPSITSLYLGSLVCASDAVRLTTRDVVHTESRKPRARLSDSASFTTASPALSDTTEPTALDPSHSHVWLDEQRLRDELSAHPNLYGPSALPPSWAQWYHYCDTSSEFGEQRTAQYVFVLDALNFCFWPLAGYEYAELAGSLKVTLLSDPHSFSAERLACLTSDELRIWLQPPSDEQRRALIAHAQQRASDRDNKAEIDNQQLMDCNTRTAPALVVIPLLDSRTRALNELGLFLLNQHTGLAINLLRSATLAPNASTFITHILAHLPAYRDHCVHPATGDQVFLLQARTDTGSRPVRRLPLHAAVPVAGLHAADVLRGLSAAAAAGQPGSVGVLGRAETLDRAGPRAGGGQQCGGQHTGSHGVRGGADGERDAPDERVCVAHADGLDTVGAWRGYVESAAAAPSHTNNLLLASYDRCLLSTTT